MAFTICVFGDRQVGKKCFVNRMLTGEYKSVLIRNTHNVATTNGVLTITYVVDTVAAPGCDGYIYMYGIADSSNIPTNLPANTVVVASKCDGDVTAAGHLATSAKWLKNLEETVVQVLQVRYPNIQLTENVALVAPVVNVPRNGRRPA